MTSTRAHVPFKGPRVGLLSIGEEEHKGNELTRSVTPILKSLPINFIGNVEGRDIYSGDTDVIVCDGFVGNIAFKVSEGLVDISLICCAIRSKPRSQEKWAMFSRGRHLLISRSGGLLRVRRRAPARRQRRLHHTHGSSNANAMKNTIRVAAEFAAGRINERIEDELGRSAEFRTGPAAD